MTTALIVVLNVFFIAFVLVTVLGLLAWGIISEPDDHGLDRRSAGPPAGRVPAPRSPSGRAGAPSAAPRRRPRRISPPIAGCLGRAAAPSGAAALLFSMVAAELRACRPRGRGLAGVSRDRRYRRRDGYRLRITCIT